MKIQLNTHKENTRFSKETYNIAVILAAGSGTRAKKSQPNSSLPTIKQLWQLGGIPIWQHSWRTFASHHEIHHVCLVWSPEYIPQIQRDIHQITATEKNLANTSIIAGGAERSDSSALAISFCQNFTKMNNKHIRILIHDAARPLISPLMISQSIQSLNRFRAVTCALPTQDTVITTKKNNLEVHELDTVLNRQYIWLNQTPQSFHLTLLSEAFSYYAHEKQQQATDEISIVKQYFPQEPIHLIHGTIENRKLTESSDLTILRSYWKSQKHS